MRDRPARRQPEPTTLPPPGWLLDRILYRDGLAIIIDKPAGVPVHAGPGGGINLETYLEALRFGLPQAPALAHRLDRDTSGCLVLGRHRKALARLGRLFAGGQVEKTYWALVRGVPDRTTGLIELPLAKRSVQRGWWMQADPDGQPAVTAWRLLGTGPGLSWLECRPRTGRTHQIRVHLAELGHPILGDPVYGPKDGGAAAMPLQLLARAVALPLYPGRPPIGAVAAPPPHMLETLRGCGYAPDQVTADEGADAWG